MFHYTVKSNLKVFPDFSLNCPEALGAKSLIEVDGTLYQVYRKICEVNTIEAPNVMKTILILDEP